MSTQQRTTPAHAETLSAALAAVQARLPVVAKDSTANVKSDKGSYSYKYADLATISQVVLPVLGAVGLSWVTMPTLTADGRFVLVYRLLHVSGESLDGEYPLPNGTPQQVGSAITYARRYTLCSVTGVAPDEDDDGAAAGGTTVSDFNQQAAGRGWTRNPVPTNAGSVRAQIGRWAEANGIAVAAVAEQYLHKSGGVSIGDETNAASLTEFFSEIQAAMAGDPA